jgi:murein L,D-transpeptidase YafK
MRNWTVYFVFLLLALSLSGCGGKKKPQLETKTPVVTPTALATYEPQPRYLTPEQRELKDLLKQNGFKNPSSKPTIILVRKLPRRLTVYRGLTPLKTYPVVLGANPKNDKLIQGDHCTPEGVYRVVTKFHHPRWEKFILLDYPNMKNWLNFSRAKKAGKVPFDAKIGGEIGIHGTHDPVMNSAGENWTMGCVSLLNQHIDEIYPLVNDDTLVVIKKE